MLAALGAALGLAVLLLHLAGGAWYVVETPSMGVAAPVGAVVVSAPVEVGALQVGDLITFVPPGGSRSTVTHRVIEAGPGGVRTRGDANGGDDPWTLRAPQVRGRAVAVLPGVGWLLRGLPLVLGGTAVVAALTAAVRDRAMRSAVRLLGASAAVCGTVLVLRPLVAATVLTVRVAATGTDVRVVGTGLLPVRVTAAGHAVDLVSGGTGVLHLPAGTAGRIDLTTALHLAPWGWAVFAAACAVPLLVAASRTSGPDAAA